MKPGYYLYIELHTEEELKDSYVYPLSFFKLYKVFNDRSILKYGGVNKISESELTVSTIPKKAFEISEEEFEWCKELDFRKITKEFVEENWPEFFI